MGRRKLGGFTSLVNFRKFGLRVKEWETCNANLFLVIMRIIITEIMIYDFFPKNFWAVYDTVFSNCYVV